jgi:hypothetical protein
MLARAPATHDFAHISDTDFRLSPNSKPGKAGLFAVLEIAMAESYEHTVIQQVIPDAAMTALERLLLCRIFDFKREGDGWHFFAPQSPSSIVLATRTELETAIASSPTVESAAHHYVAECLAATDTDAAEISLDLSGTSWEFFFQDIVKRSATLAYISVAVAFTSTKVDPDRFSGKAIYPDSCLANVG